MARYREGALTYDLFPRGTLSLSDVDLSARVEESAYEKDLPHLQESVYAAQIRHFLKGRRAVIAFEGWDAAGKGGCIKRLTALLDPRGYKVWPIAAPNEEERKHHWLWRFWTRLPSTGELAVFDRSWYGRVLVERVEGLATKAAWKRAYDEINAFERTLSADGIRLVKFFLHIDRRTQLRRFRDREKDPVKRYKLGPEDWRNRERYPAYLKAIQDMLDRTHRPDAPWIVVSANDKKHARLEVLRTAAEVLEGRFP
ncbi:MAG TPA: polyphosphate kinase [Anaeromyxobacter sp.]|nr:polyphosphate kinase [Anaeromyxobacter sp.]